MVGMLSPITAQIGQPERVDLGQSILGGMQVNQNLQRGKLQNQAIQQDVSQGDFAMKVRNLQIMNALAKKAKALPPEQRPAFRESQMSVMQSIGVDPSQIAQAPLDDASLDQYISQSDAILSSAMPQSQASLQRGQGAIVKTKDGLSYSTPVFDPKSGQVVEALTPIGGDLVSREGETPDEKMQRQIDLKRSQKEVEQQVIAETEPAIQEEIAQRKKNVELIGARREQALKSGNQIEQLQSTIDQVKEIIPLSTGSAIGALRDSAGRLIGWSNEAAQNTAKLKALSGWMVSNIPRMEGPQSNIDVENYRTMAGRIDDPIPAEERLAALDAIQQMMAKYKKIGDKWVDSSMIENVTGQETQEETIDWNSLP